MTLPTGKVQFTGIMSTHLRDEPITMIGTLTEVTPPEEIPATAPELADKAEPTQGKAAKAK